MKEKEFSELEVGEWFFSKKRKESYRIAIKDDINRRSWVDVKVENGNIFPMQTRFYWACVVNYDFHFGQYNSPWISCKERMPNLGEVVFVRLIGGGHAIAFNETGIFQDKTHFGELQVEAWMPIPE